MSLGEKQTLLTSSLVLLLQYMQLMGYEPRLNYVRRCEDCPVGAENSLHKEGMAFDINLFKDGAWLQKTHQHRIFGEFWESLGESHRWGGRYDDGNHYEII